MNKTFQQVFLLICFVFSTRAFCKITPTLTTGIRLHTVQDFGHSPLIYNGIGGFYSLEFNRVKQKSYTTLSLGYSYAQLNAKISAPALSSENKAGHHTFNLLFGKYYNLTPNWSKLRIHFGGLVASNSSLTTFNDNGNNPYGYDFSLSINPAVNIVYPNRIAGLQLSVDFPLLGTSTRPGYKGLLPSKNGEVNLGSILGAAKFHTINKQFYLHSRLLLIPGFKNQLSRINFFYDFLGGVNNSVEYRGFTNHTVGIRIWLARNISQITIICPTE